MKQQIMGIVAAMAVGAMAADANTIKVTKFHQSYPYSGKATVEYTVGGTLPANAIAEFKIDTDDASATFFQSNIVAGANSHVIDFASSFGGAMLLTNASFVVTISEGAAQLGGVQLWENGPYWAECNVGATKPEEFGYYFWWGDTVGYTNTGSAWISVNDGTSISFANSGTAASSCKNTAALLSEGYIDSTGHLSADHDAATTHLGSPWRMPTNEELSALNNNCDWTWTTQNGVNGYVIRGRGDYASDSIFLPCGGEGHGSSLDSIGLEGCYWSSVPYSSGNVDAYVLYFKSNEHGTYYYGDRYDGFSVRPVRDAE